MLFGSVSIPLIKTQCNIMSFFTSGCIHPFQFLLSSRLFVFFNVKLHFSFWVFVFVLFFLQQDDHKTGSDTVCLSPLQIYAKKMHSASDDHNPNQPQSQFQFLKCLNIPSLLFLIYSHYLSTEQQIRASPFGDTI